MERRARPRPHTIYRTATCWACGHDVQDLGDGAWQHADTNEVECGPPSQDVP